MRAIDAGAVDAGGHQIVDDSGSEAASGGSVAITRARGPPFCACRTAGRPPASSSAAPLSPTPSWDRGRSARRQALEGRDERSSASATWLRCGRAKRARGPRVDTGVGEVMLAQREIMGQIEHWGDVLSAPTPHSLLSSAPLRSTSSRSAFTSARRARRSSSSFPGFPAMGVASHERIVDGRHAFSRQSGL